MGIRVCPISTCKVEAGESEVCGYPWLQNELEANLDYMRPRLGGKKARCLILAVGIEMQEDPEFMTICSYL